MAYARHNWVCGETITAELLNNIEDGIEEALACCGGGSEKKVLAVTSNNEIASWSDFSTYQETFDYCQQGGAENIDVFYSSGTGSACHGEYYRYDSDLNCYSYNLSEPCFGILEIYSNKIEVYWD